MADIEKLFAEFFRILAESEADKGKEGKAAQQKGAAAQQSQIDLMASDFFDIEKADGAMAELTKRQRERTMGSGLDADEQLLLSLAGPAPQSGDASNQGGMGAHEELKLLDELLSVMNQAVDGKDTASGGGLDALGDLSLDRSWHTESSAGGRNDLDFMRPAEASSLAAMMPSQLLELQSGHSCELKVVSLYLF